MKKYKLNKIGVIVYLIKYILIITLLDILFKYSITHNSNLTEFHVYIMNTITLFSKLFTIYYYMILKDYTFKM